MRYLAAYSARPKRTALYSIDRTRRKVVHLLDLPSAGDNALPSVHRIGTHEFLVANYTSDPGHADWTWMEGQVHPEGTGIYLTTISFVPR